MAYAPTPDPTPEQIAERAAAIRATWTETERRAREGNPVSADRESENVHKLLGPRVGRMRSRRLHRE